MKKIIYLDNAATMPCHKEVVKVMNEYHIDEYGNASSPHRLGEKVRDAIEKAKKIIAKEINCKPWEIIFTSGATESNNLALRGLALAHPQKKKIIISCIEHSSIYEVCVALKNEGYKIIEIPVDKSGFVDLKRLENEIDSDTLIVSIMHANNEIGTLQDMGVIGKICKSEGVLFHTDAVQSFCKETIDVQTMKIDMLSASGHKIGGPKGIGFLYLRKGIKIKPLIVGGGQEQGLRAGTENVPAIVGFAKAVEIAKKINNNKIKNTKEYFISELEKIGGKINGSKKKRLANNINVSFAGKDADMIVLALSQKDIMCSARSACISKQKKENRVLESLLLNKKEISGALRFSLSGKIGKKDIDKVVRELKKLVI